MRPVDDLKGRVRSQFGQAAGLYVSAEIYREQRELDRMIELAGLDCRDKRVLDVATGGGHTAIAYARRAAAVVAADLTPEMLAAAAEHAASLGVTNVSYVRADAEVLPFADSGFDVVAARYAPPPLPSATALCGRGVPRPQAGRATGDVRQHGRRRR